MRKVRLADLESRMGPASVILPLTDALGLADVAMNYYELDEGESTAFGYHAHENQEEVFYVESGTLTFRTADGPVHAKAGEVVRFGPGEYQRATNEHADRALVLALGAPQDAGATRSLRECDDCGGETSHHIELADDHDAVVAVCDECGNETGRYT
ncbi:cupin domain-containing protein [Halocalculus aciditolerans]|uniref:Cupin n=1 Tax=Halocalculus aciditolerans TaxID=1383812 RepID=A0A830F7F1_9EURY|nr:cupin domain-containing protein [Halocalculus aciditolerans]GGL46532.1 cupin [Halocalculus aciditolerans]